jgi:hypothetical protein
MIRIGIPPRLCAVCDDRPCAVDHTWCDDCISLATLPLEDLLRTCADLDRAAERAKGQLILEREARQRAERRLAEVTT